MAARSAGRRLWRSFRASFTDPVLGSPDFGSQSSGKAMRIWDHRIPSMNSTSLGAGCGEGGGFVAWKRIADSVGRRRLSGCSSSGSDGLSVLLHSRPDAALVVRLAVAMGSRSNQLKNPNFSSNSNSAAVFLKASSSVPWIRGARPVHGMALGKSVLSRPASTLVKGSAKQTLSGFRKVGFAVGATRRRFSSGPSSEPSWTDSWNKAVAQVRSALRWRPATRAAGGTAAKSSAAVQGSKQGGVLAEAAKPLQRTFHRYKEAAGLQLEGFWKRNYLYIVGVIALGVCLLLWRLMYAIASSFISMSEGLAKYGVLALAASMVLVGGVYLRARYTINPDAVYRAAMRKLNTSAAVLEVMGTPLAGTDLRAYVMSGGGFRLKNFKLTLAGKRCFVIFPIRGSERKGLVSLEVKKKKGQYNFKLLAVDIPTAGSADQRLFLIGDEKEYTVGGGLISELRDPIVKAMAAQKEFEDTDLAEDEEEARLAAETELLKAEEDARVALEAEKLREEEALKELEQKQEDQSNEDVGGKKQEQKVLA